MGLHRKPQPDTGKLPTPVFPQPRAVADPIQLLQLLAPARSRQEKAPNLGAEERRRIQKHPMPQSSLSPHSKNPNFYTDLGRKSCHSRGRGGKHIHPFIGGTQDGLWLRAGTAQAPKREGSSGCLRGKQGKAPAPAKTLGAEEPAALCHSTQRVSGQGGCVTAVPRGIHNGGFLGSGQWEGWGGGSPKGSAARCFPPWSRQRFFGAVPAGFVGGKKGNRVGREKGMVLPRCQGCRVFSSLRESRTSASACG